MIGSKTATEDYDLQFSVYGSGAEGRGSKVVQRSETSLGPGWQEVDGFHVVCQSFKVTRFHPIHGVSNAIWIADSRKSPGNHQENSQFGMNSQPQERTGAMLNASNMTTVFQHLPLGPFLQMLGRHWRECR